MLKSIYKNSEKGWATARVAPTEKRERAGQNPAPTEGLHEVPACGPMWASAPTEGYKECGKRAVGDAGPYGGLQEVRGERNPPVTALP